MGCVVRPSTEADRPAILLIYNDPVLTQTSIWNGAPATLAERRIWRQARAAQNYPVLIAKIGTGVCACASR
jgi:L-amino acid N-acyltransferase